ncbi:MAG: hypothetical protein JXB39_07990 [Deltaproteobacteria bacterium]|nr:hypothetical protein [Deltaproteobacteria bacterium]
MTPSLVSIAFVLVFAGLAQDAPSADPAPAGQGVGARDATTARAFADHLLESGDPFNALTWYRMALFLEPDRPDADVIRFRMAYAYEAGRRWEAAEVAYGQVLGADLADRATYRIAAVDAQAGRPEDADRWLALLADRHPAPRPDSPWAERAPYARGVVALQSDDLEEASRRFAEVPEGPWRTRARSLADAAAVRLPSRSPLLAASLSAVVPGAGQFYAGHVGDGLMALAASGVLGVWSYTLLRQGIEQDRAWEVGLGGVVGGMCTVTWSSNVVGAWRGARRFGDQEARERASELLAEAWDPALELSVEDVVLP